MEEKDKYKLSDYVSELAEECGWRMLIGILLIAMMIGIVFFMTHLDLFINQEFGSKQGVFSLILAVMLVTLCYVLVHFFLFERDDVLETTSTPLTNVVIWLIMIVSGAVNFIIFMVYAIGYWSEDWQDVIRCLPILLGTCCFGLMVRRLATDC